MKESLKTEDRIALAIHRKERAYERLKASEVLLAEALITKKFSILKAPGRDADYVDFIQYLREYAEEPLRSS